MNKWDGNYIICSIARSAQNIIPLYVLNYFSDVNLMLNIPYTYTANILVVSITIFYSVSFIIVIL